MGKETRIAATSVFALVLALVLTLVLALVLGCAGKVDSADGASGGSGSGSGSANGGTSSGSSGDPNGGATTPPTSTPPANWSGYCDRAAKRAVSCNEEDKQRECLSDGVCFANSMRAEAIDPYGECLASRPCSQPVEECIAAVSSKFASEADVTRFRTTCLQQREACKGGGPSNDLCKSATLVKTATLRDIEACLSKPCEEIDKCVDLKVAPLGCR